MENIDRIARAIAHGAQLITTSQVVVHEVDDLPPEAPRRLAILEFPPATDGLDWIYLTAGMSDIPIPGTDGDHRLELIMYSQQKDDHIVDLLAGLATYPFTHNVRLGPGDTIPGRPHRGVVPGSHLTDLVLLKPNFDRPEAARIEYQDGSHAQVLWVVPISAGERQLVIEQGLENLYRAMKAAEVDVGDLLRRPLA
jgi:hypothetical protein